MIIFILFLLCVTAYATPGTYECGLHGRFEYCIDGFPGCVVGCHCYPGYYFDTDSKICEPNTKLTQDYRRHLPPTGYNQPMGTVAQIEPATVASAQVLNPNPNDAQDNGDLSDWLYNQFFKTIENQVINNTKEDEHLKAGTRRSGAPSFSFPTRKHSNRRKKSHKYSRKRGSRKKVQRIRSDDSSSQSSSSSESSGSSSDESSSLGSWERFEWGPRPDKAGDKESNAHREIVVYSKKPKPPLPSFIFLPNMQTPYFPPIGLAAPPVPMYPMVPIPPIHPGCVVENATSSVSTPETTTTAITTTPPPAINISTLEEQNGQGSSIPSLKKALRSNDAFFNYPAKDRRKPQLNTVYKLPPPSKDYFMKQYQDSDSDPMFLSDNNIQPFVEDMKIDKEGEEPNFKYISQLIHKNFNDATTRMPGKGLNPNRQGKFVDMKPRMPFEKKKRQQIKPGRLDDSTRRRFDPRNNGQDDSYYSTLGRQIAMLIRGLESKGIPEANIKIEREEDSKPGHPFFSESSFSARSYWERFIRSPLSVRLNNFTKYDNLIASNEKLFDLENKVQEATTTPSLSLHELENLINTMETMRSQVHRRKLSNNYNKPSNRSLNISLLPRFTHNRSSPVMSTTWKRQNLINGREIKNNYINTSNGNINISLLSPFSQIQTKKQQNPELKIRDHMHVPSKVLKNFSSEQKFDNAKTYIHVIQSNNTNNKTERFNTFINQHKLVTLTAPPKSKSLTSPIQRIIHLDTPEKIDQKYLKTYNYNKNDEKSRIIFEVGRTEFTKSKKYFFDQNMSYRFENWSSE